MSSAARLLLLAPLMAASLLLQDPVRLPLQDALSIWRYQGQVDRRCEADTLLVMGAAQYDGVPSPALRRRLDLAHEIFASGCGRSIVVSGGRGEGDRYSEGEVGVSYLAALGVPPEALSAETEATTSYENLRNSLPLIAGDRVLIVTDDLHAARSLWLARRFGLRAQAATVTVADGRLAYGVRELLGLLGYQAGLLR